MKIKLPENYRKIRYILPEVEHRNKMGVYVIWFGDKFYIGRTKNFGSRLSGHKTNENSCFGRYLFGNDISKEAKGSVFKIVKHLYDNPDIHEAHMQILEICDTEEDCKYYEAEWLQTVVHVGFHDMCLNADFFTQVFNTEPDIKWMKEVGILP